MAEVRLPGALITLFPGASRRVALPGATVGDVLVGLDDQSPGMRDRLLTAGPSIREHIRVFVDGEPADLASPVAAGSIVDVVLAVSGG